MDFPGLLKTNRFLNRLFFPIAFRLLSLCFQCVFRTLCGVNRLDPVALRVPCGCVEVSFRQSAGCTAVVFRLLAAAFWLCFACSPFAFRLLPACFPLAVRVLSDGFLFVLQCLSAYVPVAFRLVPASVPIAVVCWLTALCFAAARRVLTSLHADPFRLIHACWQQADPWHSGSAPVADRLFSGMMPQLSEASNIVYARDGLTPTNRCRHPAVRSCVGIICDGRRSPSGCAGACVARL